MSIDFKDSELFIFTGGLGSGKTEIAVNYSLYLSEKSGKRVELVDLDIIKPYYRSRQLIKQLEKNNIKIVAPPAPYVYADLPLLPPEVNAILRKPSGKVVIDLGGDDDGARVLGCYHDELKNLPHQFLYVVNTSRPLSGNYDEIMAMINAIEKVSDLKISGIINNTHMMWETTPEIISNGAQTAQKIANSLRIPLVFHCIKNDFKDTDILSFREPVFHLKLFLDPELLHPAN